MDAYWENRIKVLEQKVMALRTTDPLSYIHAEYTTNTASAMTNADWTILNYEDKVIDTHNAVTVGASWKFTAPATRPYYAAAMFKLADSTGWTAGERVFLGLYKNGSLDKTIGYATVGDNGGAANISMAAAGSTIIFLNVYDYISFYCYQDSDGAINLNELPANNWCSITAV